MRYSSYFKVLLFLTDRSYVIPIQEEKFRKVTISSTLNPKRDYFKRFCTIGA